MMKLMKLLSISAIIVLCTISSCKNDQTKTKELVQDEEFNELIQVTFPEAGTEINSPLEIQGRARGTWFFEGDFPIFLLDSNGKEMGVGIATAEGNWMTEDWVKFTATMEFQAPAVGEAILVFQKSNPSDNRELDKSFKVPVKF